MDCEKWWDVASHPCRNHPVYLAPKRGDTGAESVLRRVVIQPFGHRRDDESDNAHGIYRANKPSRTGWMPQKMTSKYTSGCWFWLVSTSPRANPHSSVPSGKCGPTGSHCYSTRARRHRGWTTSPFQGMLSLPSVHAQKAGQKCMDSKSVCDSRCSHILRVEVPNLPRIGQCCEMGQRQRIVLEMMEGLQGVTVNCDNFFFTWGALAQQLRKRKIALVGTMKRNRPELPPALLQTRGRAALSSVFAFSLNTTTVSYVPKRGRYVLLISTRHGDAEVSEGGWKHGPGWKKQKKKKKKVLPWRPDF